MSAVRMCDRDGTIFSERAEGWGTFTGSTMRRDERTGRQSTIQETLDLCPRCNSGANMTPTAIDSIPRADAAERLADINEGTAPTLHGQD